MATLAMTAFLAPLVPEKPMTSIHRPHDFITPGRSVITAATQRLEPQETKRLPEVAEWLQEGMAGGVLGPTVLVDLVDSRRTISVALPQPSPDPLQPEHYAHRLVLQQKETKLPQLKQVL